MIEKIILRDQVRQYLQTQMLQRKIDIGEPISLAELARKIDVSVTPIREALTQLEQAGIVKAVANRGFFVPEQSMEEAEEIYPIIISLERSGVEASKYDQSLIDQLEKALQEFENASGAESAVHCDLKFHNTLLSNYKNRMAQRILSDLKVRVFFYELDYMQSNDNREISAGCHRQIINALADGMKDSAINLLAKNWSVSLEFIRNKSLHYA